MARYGIVVDVNKCTGCMTCVLACKEEHLTGPEVSWTRVYQLENEQENSIRYSPVMCMHCDAAPCIEACKNQAISLRADGIVVIDQNKCTEIGACFSACPYGAIAKNPDKSYFPTPQPFEKNAEAYRKQLPGKASKCTLCSERIDQGGIPHCVEVCQSGALIFGDLDDPDSAVSQQQSQAKEALKDKQLKPKIYYLAADGDIANIDNQFPTS